MPRRIPPRSTLRGAGWLRSSGGVTAHAHAETHELCAELRRRHAGSHYRGQRAADRLVSQVRAGALRSRRVTDSLGDAFATCARGLIACEHDLFDLPAPPPEHSMVQSLAARELYRSRIAFFANEEKLVGDWTAILSSCLSAVTDAVPALADKPAALVATVPLIDLMDDAVRVIRHIVAQLLRLASDPRALCDQPGSNLAARVMDNLLAASQLTFEMAQRHPERLRWPGADRAPPREQLDRYLAHTPFTALFSTSIPFAIPRKVFTEHGAIFAPSGHGKTQTLQNLIASLLNDPDPPAMFIIDSQGSMLRKIEHLAVFAGRLKDRLVVLDPPEPALNFFQFDGSNTEVLELFHYLFAALDRSLTAKQGTAIPYLLKLLQQIPDATLDTLREIMDDKSKFEASPYYDRIMQLDARSQDFFRHQFYGQEMKAAKQQVANRLYTVLGSEAFVQMFAARENRFNAYEAMQQKKIVLVNTSQRVLGETASSIFGRFVIAQLLAAAYQRDPDADNHLALIILDEAFEYFDEKTERLLSQARKYSVGALFATQYLEQMPPGVKAAVNATTAIKMAGPVSYNDAMMLAREMYTTGDFLRSMRAVDRSHTEFACYVRNLTPQAIKLTVPYGSLEQMPRMSASAHSALREANRRRYGIAAAEPRSADEAPRIPSAPRRPAPSANVQPGATDGPAAPSMPGDDPARAVDK